MIIGSGSFEAGLFPRFKNNHIRRISESFNAQFRAEIFNIFNRTNFSRSPSDNLAVFDQNGLPIQSGGLIDSTQTTSRQIHLQVEIDLVTGKGISQRGLVFASRNSSG